MKKILFYIISTLITCNYADSKNFAADTLSNSSQISILTSSPWSGAVYAVFGHSAMRITDTELGIDDVYNYGIFYFNSSNFIWRFATGETDYFVAKVDFTKYIYEYRLRGSNVYEQVINLTQQEKQKIWDFLKNNIKPENLVYRYNEIFNNCTTKLTDIIENNVEGEIVYPKNMPPKTFRELLSEFTSVKPWVKFGVNTIFGAGADKTTTLREMMFLPLYQVNTFDNTFIKINNDTVPLVLSKKKIVVSSVTEKQGNNFFTSPFFVGILILLLTIGISLYEYKVKKYKWGKFFDFILFFTVGILGCVILFMMFTLHPFTHPNWHIVWLNPVVLIFSFVLLIKPFSKVVYYFQILYAITLTVFLLTFYLLPQDIEIAFIPFILSVWLRTLMYIISYRKLKTA